MSDIIIKKEVESIFTRIEKMNKTFSLPCNKTLTNNHEKRIVDFYRVIQDEVSELPFDFQDKLDDYVELADCIADLIVYCISEACRWGIPLEEVLHLVMDSQDSKLDENGNAIMSEDGRKFEKGPNYEPPERKIRDLLEKCRTDT